MSVVVHAGGSVLESLADLSEAEVLRWTGGARRLVLGFPSIGTGCPVLATLLSGLTHIGVWCYGCGLRWGLLEDATTWVAVATGASTESGTRLAVLMHEACWLALFEEKAP